MNIADWLWRTARNAPDSPALFWGSEYCASYADFADVVAYVSGRFAREYALAPGERVGIFMSNQTEYLIALFSIWAAGAVAVPINSKLHSREAVWIVKDSGAKLCLVDEKSGVSLAQSLAESEVVAELLDLRDWGLSSEALVRSNATGSVLDWRGSSRSCEPCAREPRDLAWLFYTSGTTGRPKGVMLSHANLQAMSYAYLADVEALSPESTALYAAPISHGAGLYVLPHVLAGSMHVVPASGGFDSAEIFSLAECFENVSMFAAPTMVKRLVDFAKREGKTGEGIATIIYGGGPMYFADIVEAVEVLGDRFVQIYGQGESPMTITRLQRARVSDRSHPRWESRLASVGTAHSCVEVKIADDVGERLGADQVGEIWVKGATVMQGYWNNPEATKATLIDGWLKTGDMGALDADGFLTLKDRSKDVIVTGGSNVYPREVEEVLLTHPSIAEVSVVGQADPEWGEIIVAFIVALEPNPSIEELNVHCLEHIARFKRPKVYRFVDELPKNNYGKVLKTELRALLADEVSVGGDL